MPLRRLTLLAATALSLCAPATAGAALHTQLIGSFAKPVYVAAPPGDPHRVFVVQQAGRIIEVRDGVVQSPPFLDITSRVRSGGEQGLLSMAFAPDYATSGRYYVYYTAPRTGDANGSVITVDEISPAGRRTIFTVDHPTNPNHNGGQLQFGPDGLLYAATGDGGSGNDPPNNAQNPNSRLGKVLRVDPLGPSAATPSIYALGLRNPFRFSFDRATGDLTIGDVGQNAYEEVDVSLAGTPAGLNYGWRCREGFHPTPSLSTPCSVPGAVDPVLEKDHSGDGYCAIIGGYVVRNASVPELNGRYVYGDNCATEVRSAALNGTGRVSDDTATGLTLDGLTSFGEDSCGHLYATTGAGPVYRIDGETFVPCPEGTPGGGGGTGGGGGGTGGGGSGGGGGGAGADVTPPALRVTYQRRQPALRLRGFRLGIACGGETCGATATGTVELGGRVYVLKRVALQIPAGGAVKVRLRASKLALKAIRRARRHHRSVSAKITVTAVDASGNPSTIGRRVRVR